MGELQKGPGEVGGRGEEGREEEDTVNLKSSECKPIPDARQRPHEVFHYPASPAKIFSSASSLSPPVGVSWEMGGVVLVTKVLREGSRLTGDKEKSWASYQELSGSQVTGA